MVSLNAELPRATIAVSRVDKTADSRAARKLGTGRNPALFCEWALCADEVRAQARSSCEELPEIRRRQRLRAQESLPTGAAFAADQIALRFGLDPLGGNGEA